MLDSGANMINASSAPVAMISKIIRRTCGERLEEVTTPLLQLLRFDIH